MIHNKSSHPVLIKKIDLNIWTLREEIEALVHEKLVAAGNDHSKVNITHILSEYDEDRIGQEPPAGKISEAESLDDSEDAMAAAMAEGATDETAENSNEVGSESPTSKTSNNDDTPITRIIEENGETFILQKKPPFSEDIVSKGISILAEVNMESIYFFSTKEYLYGQSIVLEFLVPKRFIANAEVVFCRPYNMKSRIISGTKLDFRIGARFKFLKTGERTLLRQFVKSIEPNFESGAAPAKGGNEDEGDGLEALDDLDL